MLVIGIEEKTKTCIISRMSSQARAEKGIKKPNIVMPVTGHVAVDKVQSEISLFISQHEHQCYSNFRLDISLE